MHNEKESIELHLSEQLNINSEEDLLNVSNSINFKDTEKNTVYSASELLNDDNYEERSTLAIPLLGKLFWWAFRKLIRSGVVVIVAGSALTLAHVALKNIYANRQSSNHYAAYLIENLKIRKTNLFLGNSLNTRRAMDRLRRGENVWSKTKKLAHDIAKSASPVNRAVGPEIDSNLYGGKFYHFHMLYRKANGKFDRKKGHSFYGYPVY